MSPKSESSVASHALSQRRQSRFHPASTNPIQKHRQGESPCLTSRFTMDRSFTTNDWGSGQPIVFSHGWPLSADAFEDQMFFLSNHGYRSIAHDRRGHGRRRDRKSVV